ncbi:3'-5' exonuclease [Marichromatium gracile]|uniref:DNA polymerase III subunit epsilon n=1 Tax=Marichromatium gracile TaxID=1048 RepID=A0ABR5VDS1_MARGR|nr:3'-5' exonuclease [Marichromatium gracile]KXX63569.1 DNA polymerase III subunit epsilon [Marichromatium gracile]
MPGPIEWRRRWRLRRAPQGPLREHLAQPTPRPRADWREVEYLAVDLETTGLDPRNDQILSVGHVVVRGAAIDLASARRHLVRVGGAIPEESAVIHQITDDQAACGGELEPVLAELLAALAGRVLIAHHASIELGFLSAACRRLWRQGLLTRVIDTQVLAHRTFERRQIPFRGSDLRLYALCDRYNLPRHGAHDALGDALAAAELFLAQAAYRDDGKGVALGAFLC